MSTDLETFYEYLSASTEEFNAWNERQPDNKKIFNRLPFTVRFKQVKLDKIDTIDYVDKDGKPGKNKFRKFKMIDTQGCETSAKAQSPSVIAPRGYCTIKTDNGDLKAIPVLYDLQNPDHRIFIDNIDDSITRAAVHEIMKEPGAYGPSFSTITAITDFNETVCSSREYEMSNMIIRASISKVVNYVKLNKTTYDKTSSERTIFLNPLFYQNREKPNDAPIEMSISVKTTPGEPAIPISMSMLHDICAGKIFPGGENHGFECSPEISFIKLNIGSKISTKTSCTAITITRFFIAPKNNTQETKLKYIDERGVVDQYTSGLGNMHELLAGLKYTITPNVINSTMGEYNPMGNSSLPPPIENNSLLTSLEGQPINEINNPPHSQPAQTINLQALNPMMNFPQQIQYSSMPNQVGMSTIDTTLPPFADRLQAFQNPRNVN